MADHGFNEVLQLAEGQPYAGSAEKVMLVWNEFQIVPAEQYRKAHFEEMKVDIAICENPNSQKEQLGDAGLIYHFS